MAQRFDMFLDKRLMRAFQTGRILPFLFLTMGSITVIFALIMRVVDTADYPTFGKALWWSVQTVTTVGYGDVTPVEPYGRAVATVLMISGYVFLSLVTGVVASALVTRHRSGPSSHELDDVLERIDGRLAALEEADQAR